MLRSIPALSLALALAWPARAAAGEGRLDLGLELLAGVDSNPRRSLEPGSDADGFAQLLARLGGGLSGDRWSLSASLHEGLRLFAGTPSARALASRLEAGGWIDLGRGLSAGLSAQGSDLREQGGRLDQDAQSAEATLAWDGQGAGASLSGGWARFAPRDAPLRPFGSRRPGSAVRTWVAPAPGHRLEAGFRIARASHPGWPGGRRDDALGVAAGWTWRGPLVGALDYDFSWNDSSAAGADFRRHRVALRAVAPLPGGAALVARAALHWTHRPEPLQLPEEQLRIEAGQEALDLADLRVALPLGRELELVVGAAGQRAKAGAGAPSYSRMLLTLGLAWRARWERGAIRFPDSE